MASRGRKCQEHGSTMGRQSVKSIRVSRGIRYPRPGLVVAEGAADEIECPHCGRANDVTDDVIDVQGFTKTEDCIACGHCGEAFAVVSVFVIVTVRARTKRGPKRG